MSNVTSDTTCTAQDCTNTWLNTLYAPYHINRAQYSITHINEDNDNINTKWDGMSYNRDKITVTCNMTFLEEEDDDNKPCLIDNDICIKCYILIVDT